MSKQGNENGRQQTLSLEAKITIVSIVVTLASILITLIGMSATVCR